MYLENAFPEKHLSEYHNWVGPDKNKAIALCSLNALVSASLVPALNIFEVTLRDAIDSSFSEHYGTDWIHQDLIKYRLQNQKINVNPKNFKLKKGEKFEVTLYSQVIAEMSLFYWTNILHPINNHLWEAKGVRPIFNFNEEVTKAEVFRMVNGVRFIRNRIAHHKSIVQQDLVTKYKNCLRIIGLLSADALLWCTANCNFGDVHPEGNVIKNDYLSPDLDLSPWMQFTTNAKE